MEALGVRCASLRSRASLGAGAAIAALAALERDRDRFASPVADHEAAQIPASIPTAPSGLVACCGGCAVSHPVCLFHIWLASATSFLPFPNGRKPKSARQRYRFGALHSPCTES